MEHHPPRLRLIDGFRTYAAALVVDQGHQIGEVARRLGIDSRLLNRWVQAFGGTRPPPAPTVEEIARLRAERDALLTVLRLALTGSSAETSGSSPGAHTIPIHRTQTGSR